MVARNGAVAHVSMQGWADREGHVRIGEQTLFRWHSMTKPITSVAVLLLVEEGKLSLDAPVAQYLPSFAKQKVAQPTKSGRLRYQKPARAVTVRDMLTHTSGLIDPNFAAAPLANLYFSALEGPFATNRDLVDALGGLPLGFEPGTQWAYGYSTDVAAAIVEVVAGQSFRDFLHTRIFQPLGMVDTDYYVTDDRRTRLAAKYYFKEENGTRVLALLESPLDNPYLNPDQPHRGGTGLVGTASDYLRFAQMLLNGGALEGVRLLQPETVALLNKPQVADEVLPLRVGPLPFPGPGYTFGLGVAVMRDPSQATHGQMLSPGTYWWVGAANTYFWIDPTEQLIGLIMTQLRDFRTQAFYTDFQRLVYQALDDGES